MRTSITAVLIATAGTALPAPAQTADLRPEAIVFRNTVIGGAVSVQEYAVRMRNVGTTTWNPNGQRRVIHFDLAGHDESMATYVKVPPGTVYQIGVGMSDQTAFAHCSKSGVWIDRQRTAGQVGPNVYANDNRLVTVLQEGNMRVCLSHARFDE